jgi:hypothetical protein
VTRITVAQLKDWLAGEGVSRSDAIRQASNVLLLDYFRVWSHIVPVELHRLSASLQAEIVRSASLKGEAVLLPCKDGFRILVNSSCPVGRFRTSVAHELAHTLFYDVSNGMVPERRVPHTNGEESFCFDVARHVLAPKEHLHAIGIFVERSPSVILAQLTKRLLLSRPWAARVMLADYALVRGIAGRWQRTEKGWTQVYGSSSATPSLTQRERRNMRETVDRWLEAGTEPPNSLQLTSLQEKSGEGVFVLITEV